MPDRQILTLIKERTKPLHDAVEQRVDLMQRLKSRESYAALLAGFYGFYRPMEDLLGQVQGYKELGLCWAARKKCHLLEADLRTFGRDPETVPLCQELPLIDSLGPALGAMYVLEGATLGGQYIRKAAEKVLGVTPEDGCAFFSSYGERVGEMWQAFRGALVLYAVSGAKEDEVIRSAEETFRRIDGWFAEQDRVAQAS